ncbi:MAG: hypothetical protein ACXVH7_08960, partial [Thermoanaerobaculia bacterium]
MATNAAGTGPASPLSNLVTPLASLGFTDDPLQVGITGIKIVHISELRARIDNIRNTLTLPAFSWTDDPLKGIAIQTVHVTELRTALEEAYKAASKTLPTYTDPNLAAGTPIRAVHITELRAAVVAIE